MRTVKWNAFLSGLCGFAVVLGVMAGGARADVTTEKGASILIFPKVRAIGGFDTIIQIANTGNSMVHARCFYVNATLSSSLTGLPCVVPSATCTPSWQETDFNIWLTKQQPTHWLVSAGRPFITTDPFGSNGYGFDPGVVPPVQNFDGELKCVEVTEAGDPWIGNHLKGEATIKTVAGATTGDVSKYNAIGIIGNPDATPSNPLLLDGNMYAACPSKLILNHFATGPGDLVLDEAPPLALPSSQSTELTLVPCSEDFEHQQPTTVTVAFVITSEFEQRFSASTTVSCYLSTEITNLSNIGSPSNPSLSVFSKNVLGSDVAQTEITPVANADGTINAVVGVAEHTAALIGGPSARAAYSLNTEGSLIPDPELAPPDQILLTVEQ